MCGADGQEGPLAMKFHKALSSKLKQFCWSRQKQKSDARILLEDANMVVRLAASQVDADGEMVSEQEEDTNSHLWYHVGYVNYTTWAMTFHKLLRDENGDSDSWHERGGFVRFLLRRYPGPCCSSKIEKD